MLSISDAMPSADTYSLTSIVTHGQLQGRMQPSFAAAVRRFFCLHPKIGIAINMASTVKGSAGKAHL